MTRFAGLETSISLTLWTLGSWPLTDMAIKLAIGVCCFVIAVALARDLRARDPRLPKSDIAFLGLAFLGAAPLAEAAGAIIGVSAPSVLVMVAAVIAAIRLRRSRSANESGRVPMHSAAAGAERDAFLRDRLDHLPVPVATLDEHEIITSVSDRWLATLGYSRAEVVGRHIKDFWFVPPSDPVTYADLRSRAEIIDAERVYRHSDGKPRHVLISMRLDPWHRREAIDVLTDVTARRRAEDALRMRFTHSPVPLCTLDLADVITDVSESWLALLGYERGEVIGRSIRDFWASIPDRPTTHAELLRSRGVRDLERSYRHRNGSVREVLVSACYEHNADITFIIVALVDVTARRQAEDSLRVTREQLHQAQKMDAIGQLAGGIAHDINNMLQGVSGGLDLIEQSLAAGRSDEAARHLLGSHQSVESAAGLIRRLLAISRQHGEQGEPVALNAVVVRMQELLCRILGPAIELRTCLPEGVGAVCCDPNQLESALLNLAINARDAMPQGGLLTLSTEDTWLAAADLSGEVTAAPGAYVSVTITDNGAGMSSEVQARAFEPFFTTKRTGQGSGLGLPMVLGFVHQTGGIARLESKPGRGTVVRLFLPRHGPAQVVVSQNPAPATDDQGGAGRVVLLVEDEAAVLEQVAASLRGVGYRVLVASDGATGLSIIRSPASIDILVTDIGLPGISGRVLADAARDARPTLPVLLLTGGSDPVADDECGPGVALLGKPFRLRALTMKLSALLEDAPLLVDA